MDYDKYKAILIKRRSELEESLEQLTEAGQIVKLDQTMMGRLSRMDALQSQAMAKANKNRAVTEIQKIDYALTRLSNDDFGYCIECDEEINSKRLEINPTTVFCIKCAEKKSI